MTFALQDQQTQAQTVPMQQQGGRQRKQAKGFLNGYMDYTNPDGSPNPQKVGAMPLYADNEAHAILIQNCESANGADFLVKLQGTSPIRYQYNSATKEAKGLSLNL